MTQFVTITSQGQISIPAAIRRKFSLDKIRQAIVDVEKDKIIIKPIKDLDELMGIFKTKKKISPKITRAVFEEALARGEV